MKKKPMVAAGLNFFLFGGGYVYNGRRTGHGILLIAGVVILRYAEITLFLSGDKRELWYALMAGLFCLQVALATDAHREAKEISGKV